VTIAKVPLREVIRVHYGAALKEADRDSTGAWTVFGSSGGVGKHSEPLFEYPSIVIGRKGSVGAVTYAPNGGWAIDTAFFVELINAKETNLRYLYYTLQSANLGRYVINTSIPGISREDVYRASVPLPPLPEQRRIADILDKADSIRRKRKEAIALTEELLRSAFLEMFGDPVTNPKGWPVKTIGALASADRHALAIGPFGSNLLSSDYAASGHPVIFVRDLAKGQFVWKSNVFVSEEKFAELAAHHAQPGDVLATKMGEPPGVACVVPDDFPRAVVTADVVKVSVDRSKVFPAYLAAAINSPWGRSQISGISAGITRAKITLRDFRDVQVRLPPLDQQRRYVDLVATLARITKQLARCTVEGNCLFNSLVARAFSSAQESL
jgi:type I restriction enzyme S subunit